MSLSIFKWICGFNETTYSPCGEIKLRLLSEWFIDCKLYNIYSPWMGDMCGNASAVIHGDFIHSVLRTVTQTRWLLPIPGRASSIFDESCKSWRAKYPIDRKGDASQ